MKHHHLIRVRKFNDLNGEIRETRYYRNIAFAHSRAMRWRGHGYDVDVSVTDEPVTWSRLWYAGEEWRND